MYKFNIVGSDNKDIIKKDSANIKYLMNQIWHSGKSQKFSPDNIYILCEEEEGSFVGGAFLQKLNLHQIQDDLRELVSTLPLDGYVLQCNGIYFNRALTRTSTQNASSDYYCRSFYSGLYKSLIELGRIKGVSFITIKISSESYELTKEFGSWPYVVELKPHHSCDGYFYGILPLTGTQCEVYQTFCKG